MTPVFATQLAKRSVALFWEFEPDRWGGVGRMLDKSDGMIVEAVILNSCNPTREFPADCTVEFEGRFYYAIMI